jgi:hypothetical protein
MGHPPYNEVLDQQLQTLSPGGLAAFGDAVAMMTSIVKNLPTEYPAAGINMSIVTPLRVDRYETHRVTKTRPRGASRTSPPTRSPRLRKRQFTSASRVSLAIRSTETGLLTAGHLVLGKSRSTAIWRRIGRTTAADSPLSLPLAIRPSPARLAFGGIRRQGACPVPVADLGQLRFDCSLQALSFALSSAEP